LSPASKRLKPTMQPTHTFVIVLTAVIVGSLVAAYLTNNVSAVRRAVNGI
jgi:predicted membrane protein